MKRIRIVITIITVMSLAMLVTSCRHTENVEKPQTTQAVQTTQQVAESAESAQLAPADGDIGEMAAKQIALNKVPGATEADIYEFEKEYDDGLVQYEGKIIYNGCEYEFEISGETGDIFDWEIEKIN